MPSTKMAYWLCHEVAMKGLQLVFKVLSVAVLNSLPHRNRTAPVFNVGGIVETRRLFAYRAYDSSVFGLRKNAL